MKAMARIILIGFLMGAWFTAFAQTNSDAFLNNYISPKASVCAGFVPAKTNLVLGEPLLTTFTVQNIGATNFEFWFGGDYRGTGRHDRYKITATNENGVALPDPIAHPMDFGGFVQQVNLKPGQFFTNIIWLTDFRVIDKPGFYTINCSFAFDEQWRNNNKTNPVVSTTFNLNILSRTPERVAKVLDELVAKASNEHGNDLNDTMALIARFGTNDALPRLDQLTKNGATEMRVAAIGVLPLIPTDDSLRVALDNFKDSDPKIRSAVAGTLGRMQRPDGVQALLNSWPKEMSPVAEDILRALGTSKSAQAFPVITNAFNSDNLQIQQAAIDALVNFGDSNAVSVLREHINTNFLSLRYEIVLALAEKLHQPMQSEWLQPVLMRRDFNNHWWIDSLRLLQMYGGSNAIPTMLSCLDFDAAWSDRNWWILYQVKNCQNAPVFDDYIWETDLGGKPGYPDGTPEMWTNNLRTLQKLKPLAGHIDEVPIHSKYPPTPYLQTIPPIDFTPSFKETDDGGIEIKSGFLDITMWRGAATMPYSPSDAFHQVYENSAHFRSLPNMSKADLEKIGIKSEQIQQLNVLLHEFAVKLAGPLVSDQKIGNLYNLLVGQSGCPGSDDWHECLYDYLEAPAVLKEQTKANLIDSVRIFSQNYHAGTIEFVEAAEKIFTKEQLEQILK